MTPHDAFDADLHAHLTRDANARVALGVQQGLGELPDPGASERTARIEEARGLLARLESIERGQLDFERSLDLKLARLLLDQEIHKDTYRFNGATEDEQKPCAGDALGEGIFLLFANDPRPAGERLEDITARVGRIPDYLEALLARLEVPVARWVNMELEKVAELPGLLTTITSWAGQSDWPDGPRLEAAARKALEALSNYARRLGSLPTCSGFHTDEETTRRFVETRGIELSLQELHAMARDFLARTNAEIEELRGQVCAQIGLDRETPAAALQQELARRHRVPTPGGDLEAVIERYRVERERVLDFIRTRDLFPIPAEQELSILRTPPFMQPSIPAGAMQSPPPFRPGVATSLVFLTLSEELLDEHTELSIPNMMIHEGIPGHHLQLATAARHPSLIRRHVSANDQAEGWTTMLEDYVLDLGYLGELTDQARFVAKREICRIGARVAIDLFFMSGKRDFLEVGVDCDISATDPFEAAGNLLAAVTGFVPGRVQAELNWYSQERAYPLSYLTGNTLVWQLKRDFEAAQRSTLEGLEIDRLFHRTFLEAGNMPLSFLRRVFAERGLLG